MRSGNEFATYEELAHEVLTFGEARKDRTGKGTLSLFGVHLTIDLELGFPVITSKKVNYAAVVEELLWFLRGETNINTLKSKIWNEWADESGSVGPLYGHQWRHVLNEHGQDQIRSVCGRLKHDPHDRGLIVSAWDVVNLHKMKLRPCHAFWQCYLSRPNHPRPRLDLQLYQRSADVALGVPFNIASYATLQTLLAQHIGAVPGRLLITYGDVHVYRNHELELWGQIRRHIHNPMPLPSLELVDVPDECPATIASCQGLTSENFKLVNYNPHSAVRFEVAV